MSSFTFEYTIPGSSPVRGVRPFSQIVKQRCPRCLEILDPGDLCFCSDSPDLEDVEVVRCPICKTEVWMPAEYFSEHFQEDHTPCKEGF